MYKHSQIQNNQEVPNFVDTNILPSANILASSSTVDSKPDHFSTLVTESIFAILIIFY